VGALAVQLAPAITRRSYVMPCSGTVLPTSQHTHNQVDSGPTRSCGLYAFCRVAESTTDGRCLSSGNISPLTDARTAHFV